MRTPVLIAATLLLGLTACGGGTPSSSPNPAPPTAAETPRAFPVGIPTGTPTQATIGAAGGTLGTSGGAVRIDIPAGALAGDQTVGIQPITRTVPGGTGQAYRLTSEGLTFAKPVRLTFAYTDQDVIGSAPLALSIGFQHQNGVWQYYHTPTRDPTAQTVSVETTHFSDWSLLEGVQLRPDLSEVEIREQLSLQVVSCLWPEDGGPDKVTYGYECGPSAVAFTARDWAANGVMGGNASVGTVGDTGTSSGAAVYTAPAKKPSQNPVAVSVNVSDLTLGDITLVARVRVKDPANSDKGTVTYTETGTKTRTAAAPWAGGGQKTYQNKHTYTVTGTEVVADGRLNLTFEQAGTASYDEADHQEWKVYSVCQAGGPEVLREHHIHDLKYSMTGLLKAPAKGDLLVKDGDYQLFVNTASGQMGGPYTRWSWYKLYCGGEQDDRVDRTETYPVTADINRVLQGKVGPSGELRGSYETQGEALNMPTTIRVEWNLSPESQ
ncbi:hypothetical protein E7T06_17780 [Deinococcus sp. Arct2-2]|uniref:hypothetical protein n=1 Tax=Deinococcus sp. Arct2-2 TaxID=2568653 RepID=UPI0010A34CCD|nr:hypothetical protein [Deinococcus sp. Arct2-2]THF68184.1 hypothetical protein E7T06_17780 [Deinococcus sp. Arct2-2]